jgi:hypothetical protein
LFTAQILRKTNLTEIISEARSGTIAHKNQKLNYDRHPFPSHSAPDFARLGGTSTIEVPFLKKGVPLGGTVYVTQLNTHARFLSFFLETRQRKNERKVS